MPGGLQARDHLRTLLPAGTRAVLRSYRDEADPSDVMSFDRYVVRVRVVRLLAISGAGAGGAVDLAAWLVSTGYAVEWDGKTKPVPYPAWPPPTVTERERQ
jgi:endonuclease YncB( thermonuclease family)